MGRHMQQRLYLAHFSCPGSPGFIWVYDKWCRSWLGGGKPVPVGKALQARGFYTDDTELFLSEIESAAAEALDKLRTAVPISNHEREFVADYVKVALTRSPLVRRHVIALARNHKREQQQDLAGYLARAGLPGTERNRNLANAWLEWQLKELDRGAFGSRHENVTTAAREFFRHTSFNPYSMGWVVLQRPSSTGFATCDSPCIVGDGEFQFPLSTETCLYGSRRLPSGSLRFEDGSGQLARARNAATVAAAERFVVLHEDADWVPAVE